MGWSVAKRVWFSLRRRGNVLACRDLSLAQRLRVVLRPRVNACNEIRSRIGRRGPEYVIRIAGMEFTMPPVAKSEDLEAALIGFSQVITESFVDPFLTSARVRPRPGDTVFDLGAFIGTTAAVFSRMVGPEGRVYAFEPGPVECLRKHVDENGLTNVVVVPAAVGERSGSARLEMFSSGLDSSITHRPGIRTYSSRTKPVTVTTLDEFISERAIERLDFIKMDIEGAEEWAIRGARKTIERFRPVWSISSYHLDHHDQPQHPKLVALLGSCGYSIEEYDEFHIFAC